MNQTYDIMDKNIFKQDAKQIVDLIFNKKLFNDGITRDNMNAFEELIEFILSSKYESYTRTEKFLTKMNEDR